MAVMNVTHHANLLRINNLTDYLLDVDTSKYEVIDQTFEKFSIGDARELVKKAHTRPTELKDVLIVVRAHFINHEAQNALLKVLEEPPESTKLLFIVPVDCSVLPTLLSRFNLLATIPEESSEADSLYQEFVSSSYADRISSIDRSAKAKDTKWQRAIKTGLIKHLQSVGAEVNNYKDLEFVARILLTRGASNKMLLEHLALLLPPR